MLLQDMDILNSMVFQDLVHVSCRSYPWGLGLLEVLSDNTIFHKRSP